MSFEEYNNVKYGEGYKFINNTCKILMKKKMNSKTKNIFTYLLVILFLAPTVVCPILSIYGIKYSLISLVVFIVLFLLVLFINNKYLINSFYKIKNAHNNFNIINIDNAETIKQLCNDSAVTFFTEPSNEMLDFIYNWLNYEEVIKESKINIYRFDGKTLKEAYDFSKVDDSNVFISIFLKDLDLEDPQKLNNFSYNHFVVGSRWLDDIIGNDKKK